MIATLYFCWEIRGRIAENDLLGFFDTEGIEPLMKVCSQYVVEVKREIVAVDPDLG